MINTTIVMSPIETAPSAGAGAAQKSHPDSSDFGAVLDSKIKDDHRHTQEAKPVESHKAGRDPEPKVQAKDADQADNASKDKSDKTQDKSDKTQAKSENADAKSENADAKSQNAEVKSDETQTKPSDDSATQQTKQVGTAPAVNAATPVEPVVVQVQLAGPVVQQEVSTEPAQSGAQRQTQVDSSAVKQAEPVQEIQVPVAKAQIAPEVAENAESTVQSAVQSDVPVADAQPAASGPTVTKQQVSEDTAYVGLTAKGLVQEALIKTAAADQSSSTEAVAQEQVQEGSAAKVEVQSPKDLFGTKVDPAVANAAAQAKPVETKPQDVTIKPQVIAALTDEMTTQVVKAGVSDGSARTGADSKGSTQTQTADQGAAFVIPSRTSFESVIRGLETAPTPQAVDTPKTEMYTRVIDQVVQEIRLRLFQGQTDMTVKLNPAELGALRLRVSQTADGMTSQIQASSDHVKGLLQANLPTLIQSLSDAGLKMEQVTVTSGPSYNSLMHDHAPGTAYQQGNKSHQDNSNRSHDTGLDPAMINAAMEGVAPGGSVGYSWLA